MPAKNDDIVSRYLNLQAEQYQLDFSEPRQQSNIIKLHGPERALSLTRNGHEKSVLSSQIDFLQSEPSAGFVHKYFCALSLPVKKPEDETKPILMRDGRLSMEIIPRSLMNGKNALESHINFGVPFGPTSRLVLYHIMSEYYQTGDPFITLGCSMADFMRKLGYTNMSGSNYKTLRLHFAKVISAEWNIRVEQPEGGQSYHQRFSITDDLLLSKDNKGISIDKLRLSDKFIALLKSNYVTVDWAAIRQIKDDATALDIYTFMVWRAPYIPVDRPLRLSWSQFAGHIGTSFKHMRRLRHTVSRKMDLIRVLYPGLRVVIDPKYIEIHHNPAPIQSWPKIKIGRQAVVQ